MTQYINCLQKYRDAASFTALAWTSSKVPMSFLGQLIAAASGLSQMCHADKVLATGGIDDVSQFTNNLIEEPDAMFSAGNRQAMVGLVSFLEQVKFEIQQFIEHGM